MDDWILGRDRVETGVAGSHKMTGQSRGFEAEKRGWTPLGGPKWPAPTVGLPVRLTAGYLA